MKLSDRIKSRRGSSLIEASVILPLTIFVVITIVLIVMFFYSEAVSQSSMHMAVRCGTDDYSRSHRYSSQLGRVLAASDMSDAQVSLSRNGVKHIAGCSEKVSMIHKGILKQRGESYKQARAYAVRGAESIRLMNTVK